MRVSEVAQLLKINVPTSIPFVSATESIRRRILKVPTFVTFSQRWLIQESLLGNVSLQCRIVMAIGFLICVSRSRTVATSGAVIACRKNYKSGYHAAES